MNARPSKIRLVAIDLDGTLLDDRKQVAPATAEALRSLHGKGVRVVIASARPPRSVRPIYKTLELDTWQVNYNGALIWDEPAKLAVFHLPIDGLIVKQMIDTCRRHHADVLVSCEIMDRWHTDKLDNTYTTETGKLFKPDVICSIEEMCRQPVTKLMLLGKYEIIQSVDLHIKSDFAEHVVTVSTDRELLQVMDHRVSKSAALKRICEHYGVARNEVMAIGDAPNDVGMLQFAGVAVAMENAYPIVKQNADWIAPSNNAGGVLEALKHFRVGE